MKTQLFAALLLVIVCTSCKKDYTCACGDTHDSAGLTPATTVSASSKADAQKQCTDYENNNPHPAIPTWVCQIQ